MPRKGENIYKRKDSRWEGRYVRGYDISGKAQIGYVYARTYSEAKKKLLAAKKTDKTIINIEKQRFAFYCDEWLLFRKEMRVLTVEEQNRLVKELTEDMNYVKFGILLALITGLRIGEICALRWEDISINNKVLHVSRTMQRLQVTEDNPSQKTRILIGDAKSSNSDRYIPLTDYAVDLCLQRRVSDPKAFVLTGDDSRYIEPRTLHNHLSKICRACGLKDVHFHTLRHTFATRCVEAGFEVKSLSEILGHSNTKVTMDRYVHSSMELKRNNMDKLSMFEM